MPLNQKSFFTLVKQSNNYDTMDLLVFLNRGFDMRADDVKMEEKDLDLNGFEQTVLDKLTQAKAELSTSTFFGDGTVKQRLLVIVDRLIERVNALKKYNHSDREAYLIATMLEEYNKSDDWQGKNSFFGLVPGGLKDLHKMLLQRPKDLLSLNRLPSQLGGFVGSLYEDANVKVTAAEADRDAKVNAAEADSTAKVAAAKADRDAKVAEVEEDRDAKVTGIISETDKVSVKLSHGIEMLTLKCSVEKDRSEDLSKNVMGLREELSQQKQSYEGRIAKLEQRIDVLQNQNNQMQNQMFSLMARQLGMTSSMSDHSGMAFAMSDQGLFGRTRQQRGASLSSPITLNAEVTAEPSKTN